jgi:FlaA1/EpsC-like NDP-sugar epimerase
MPINATKQSVLSLPRPIKRAVVMCLDFLICSFTVWLAFGLRLDQWRIFQGNEWLTLIAAISISFPLFITYGLYRAIFRYIGSAALSSMARVFISYAFFFSFIFTVIGVDGIPRSIGVIQPLLLFIIIGSSRYFIRYWLGGINNVQKMFHKDQPIALIYGAGSAGRQLAAALAINKDMQIKGFIDDDESLQGHTINGIPVYSSVEMQEIIPQSEVSDVLLAIPSAEQSRRNQIIESLSGCGVRVRTLPGLVDMASGRVRISDLHDLDMNDLLGRKVVPPNVVLLEKNIRNQVVLVTGAGGSIGGELCRQIIKFGPSALILIENSEHNLYLIYEELKRIISGQEDMLDDVGESAPIDTPLKIVPCLASVRDKDILLNIFNDYRPNTVFHAAAYKHVPLVEQNPAEGIRNNVFGTFTCALVSLECQVSHFILISTDKAVRPTNVMGASKRVAELVLQAIADRAAKEGRRTQFSMVRFGNVLGSSGSVAPLFSAQIKGGGPITLTHSEVTRYFMTIPEAAQLVIQASSMATGGDVFVLDMGQPVRIYDLAVRMIHLSGLLIKDKEHPNGDIEIVVTGLRPGEKLYEELLIGDNPKTTAHPKIMKAHEEFLAWDRLELELTSLNIALDAGDLSLIRESLKKLVPGYQPHIEKQV